MTRVASASLILLTVASGCATEGSQAEQGSGETEVSTTSDTDTGETGETCEVPENATPEQMVVIAIRNERDVPIYVVPYSSFGCNYGKVEIELGGEPVLWDHSGTYAYDCSAQLCDWGCSNGGAMGLIINPGAEAEVEWNGGVWMEVPLSDACRAEADCLNDPGPTCSVLEVLEDQEYLVRVNLSETCPLEDECMACTEGVCEVFFDEPAPGVESFEVSAVFPAGAEVVID